MNLSWFLFAIFIIGMFAIDFCIFHRKSHTITFKKAVAWSITWIAVALLFNLYIYYTQGAENALLFLTGYLVEKSLSIDNLFVFLLIFKYFHTPAYAMHKVLSYGVIGAMIMRAIFIWFGIFLVSQFHWMIYVFGAFLLFTGGKLWMEKKKKIDPENNLILKMVRHFFPLATHYEGDRLFIFKQSRYLATPLFIVMVSIETTDILFAIDSIPAILSITHDPFIVYTSNIFAILGLRSLYFVLQQMMELFHYLHYGLAAILMFIGIKMIISDIFPIHVTIALAIVFVILVSSIVLSLLFPKRQ